MNDDKLMEMDCQLSTGTLGNRSNLNSPPKITLELNNTSLSNSPSKIILGSNDTLPNFCGKPARKYASNKPLSSEITFNFEDCWKSQHSEMPVANEPYEKPVISDASRCELLYDSDYTLNWLKFNESGLRNQKCVTMSDIARYAANLPYMTSRTETSEQCEDKSKDYFDDATMELVRHNLFQLSSIDGMDTGGPPSAITFHSTVKARRISESGKVNLLLHWSPENMVQDTWIAEDELCLNYEKTIPVSQLPHDALQLPVMDVFGSAGILSPPGKRKRK